ncbi:unnamed protein product [Zymoseptoria tritici ST99CH_3D7]|uniref:PD-(D/E)XK nuclease-like domain-containing protein n=1 Tax=Zymoseptoria tritici (strain ST99CH_3D7) TaxID=1276538 RepID=A0A1X7SAE2_ZYMT9|nr:unnamed protein product [Zymoseptoria tritici ST99CH_3D7]
MPTPVARQSRRPAARPDNRFATHFPPPSDDDVRSYGSASSHSTKHSTRSKSPMKDAVDLRLADTSIRYCRRSDVALLRCLDNLCEELEAIAEGDELIPETIWARMRQQGESKLKARHKAPEAQQHLPLDYEHNFLQLCDILKDALRQEDDNASEPPHEESLYFHNITTSRPVLAWVPTRELQASESRLVDYSINLTPSYSERAVIETFLKRQPHSHATITQTMYAAVRVRPCIASIETKTVSEFDKAKNQLAVWSAAHLARVREFATDEDQELFVHPLIHVQHHSWKMYFAIAQLNENAVDIVNANITLSATDSLLDLWKLMMSLRCLAR